MSKQHATPKLSESEDAPVQVVTAGLRLETSLGPLTVDLFGADCPALTANFLNLCRAQLWNGAVATEVVPEVAVFFSHSADGVYQNLLHSLLQSHTKAVSPSSAVDTLNFWSLLPRRVAEGDTAASASPPMDPVEQQEAAVRRVICQEVQQCKRRRCIAVSEKKTSNSGSGDRDGMYQPVYVPAGGSTSSAFSFSHGTPHATTATGSPCSVTRAGCLLVDITSPTLRFGLTLSNRNMDFLDRQYVTIGQVSEGETLLGCLRSAPLHDREAATPTLSSDTVAGRPAASWPRPARMIRVKRALVLRTAGTEKFVPLAPSAWWSATSAPAGGVSTAELQQRRVAMMLHSAGCFQWWASAAAVRSAHHQLVELVQASLKLRGYTVTARPSTFEDASLFLKGMSTPPRTPSSSTMLSGLPLIVLRSPYPPHSHGHSGEVDGELDLTYNPHYAGEYLSSGEEEEHTTNGGESLGRSGRAATQGAASAKRLEERRQSFMQQHQEKANETLSLMLNVLNGVADVRGDIKPPDNVLFVCKLNPVTTGEGLALCFAQFGRVTSAEVIYDARKKQSLCYGFVEFETVEACFRAFQKMDRALLDDCRIHVDFSQSVSKLWAQRQREIRKRPHAAS